MPPIPWLDPNTLVFPPAEKALEEPNGLLAAGGNLSPQRIINAYRHGIFPWFNPGDPILWWSPNPRTVIYPDQLHLSRSLQKTLRKKIYRVTFDQAFCQVMEKCAASRSNSTGTWISREMIKAYVDIHRMGLGHSVEVWRDENGKSELVGGLYGLALGRVFFGESMFSQADNASKVGLAHLVHHLRAWQFELIDCQVANDHLFSLGAVEIAREVFLKALMDFSHKPSLGPPDNDWANVVPDLNHPLQRTS